MNTLIDNETGRTTAVGNNIHFHIFRRFANMLQGEKHQNMITLIDRTGITGGTGFAGGRLKPNAETPIG